MAIDKKELIAAIDKITDRVTNILQEAEELDRELRRLRAEIAKAEKDDGH